MNLKFAETVFAATEERVTSFSCPAELCLPVTARFILLELFVRKVGLEIFLFLADTVSHFLYMNYIEHTHAQAVKSLKTYCTVTSTVVSSRASQQIMLVNIC